ncbi:MAG TPA: 3-dehydroquinate synthase, partial [Chthoniobacterales bacterium]
PPLVKVLSIGAGAATYDAVIGPGALDLLRERAAKLFRGRRCAVVSDDRTGELFGGNVRANLRAHGFDATLITFPPGEASKSLEQLGRICEQMAAAGLDRTSFVVALGGGVVGDIAGFAAAIYHRGIPYVQAPTTLLAQVDSAIGGKTAVNTSTGKNLLGAVHQPALVLADTATLRTLPAREFNQGSAEIIKHAIIADPGLFELLEQAERDDLAELVARNIAIKASIVARDEHDVSGARAVLNFGHTAGHAIERAAGYGALLHGEAISLGIVAACDVSVRKVGFPESDRAKVIAALEKFKLPTSLAPDFPRDGILSALRADKKFERDEVRFVVSPALGSAHLTSAVSFEEIAEAVARL